MRFHRFWLQLIRNMSNCIYIYIVKLLDNRPALCVIYIRNDETKLAMSQSISQHVKFYFDKYYRVVFIFKLKKKLTGINNWCNKTQIPAAKDWLTELGSNTITESFFNFLANLAAIVQPPEPPPTTSNLHL